MSESMAEIGARRVIALERPADGVAVVTWRHPEVRNHGTLAPRLASRFILVLAVFVCHRCRAPSLRAM